jgi:hypothetical protein
MNRSGLKTNDRRRFRALLTKLVWSGLLMVGLSTIFNRLQSVFVPGTIPNDHSSLKENSSFIKLRGKSNLRFNWSNLEPLSALARNISFHQQQKCDLPLARHQFCNRHGLGADLHFWSQAICNGMEHGFRIRTAFPWLWYDEYDCHGTGVAADKMNNSVLTCYFPQSELQCPNDRNVATRQDINQSDSDDKYRGVVPHRCPIMIEKYGLSEFRAATTEFLFTKVSPIIQEEAERQASLVFGSSVPKELITVQIRWGDKHTEMNLVPIGKYIDAVKQLLTLRQSETRLATNGVEEVNIFLSTEDPRAVEAFRQAADSSWKIFVDQYFQETSPFRKEQYNNNPNLATRTNGKTGLVALGSLLLAMEANDFVLSTGSNWSRLMNELRKNILNPRCQNCTRCIDLLEGEW